MLSQFPTFRNHLFAFNEGELALHRNLMPCAILGRQHPVNVANDETSCAAMIVCIKPDIPHRVFVPECGADIIYFDGLHIPQNAAPFQAIDPIWHGFPSAFGNQDQISLHRFRTMLEGNRPPPDPKVMEIIEQLYTAPLLRMPQTDLAQRLGLERTQALRHFKATTGQTFRKFKIWAGIVAAAHSAFHGEQIGLAGVEADFADAAHTTRTAMATFGMTPTQGLAGLTDMKTLI